MDGSVDEVRWTTRLPVIILTGAAITPSAKDYRDDEDDVPSDEHSQRFATNSQNELENHDIVAVLEMELCGTHGITQDCIYDVEKDSSLDAVKCEHDLDRGREQGGHWRRRIPTSTQRTGFSGSSFDGDGSLSIWDRRRDSVFVAPKRQYHRVEVIRM